MEVTTKPLCLLEEMNPSDSRCLKASRMGVLLTFQRLHNSCSDSFMPGGKFLLTISIRIEAHRSFNDTFLPASPAFLDLESPLFISQSPHFNRLRLYETDTEWQWWTNIQYYNIFFTTIYKMHQMSRILCMEKIKMNIYNTMFIWNLFGIESLRICVLISHRALHNCSNRQKFQYKLYTSVIHFSK